MVRNNSSLHLWQHTTKQMGTPIAVVESMARDIAEGLGSEDKDPFLTLAGSSTSHAVRERPIYSNTAQPK